MCKRSVRGIIVVAFILCSVFSVSGQEGAGTGFSPYSAFGIGDLSLHGSAYNRGMGGVGLATRNKRYINYLNPASVTARDSLSFMCDFSLQSDNKIFRQGSTIAGNNSFCLNDLVMSFPIYRSSAMMLGITPYSSTGYAYSSFITDENQIAHTGNFATSATGQGGMYQLFVAGAVTFWKKLSLGVQGSYYFGNINKKSVMSFSNSSFNGFYGSYELELKGPSVKFGLQYEQPVGDIILGVGATYSLPSQLNGIVYKNLSYSSTTAEPILSREDTLGVNTAPIYIPSEFGVGLSVRGGERWRAEINYINSDWNASNFDSVEGLSIVGKSKFGTSRYQSFRAGFEIVPNANDIRYYFKRCAYRAGAYYEKSYFLFDGASINSYGLTFGITLPVFMLSNGITFTMDVGRRGNLAGMNVRETYCNFSIGVNAYDIWFQKYRYN